MRDGDSRSSISRAMQRPVHAMARKRSRTCVELRRALQVSMKPTSEASGVHQFMAGVGDEVDAQPLDTPGFPVDPAG